MLEIIHISNVVYCKLAFSQIFSRAGLLLLLLCVCTVDVKL